MNTDTGQIPTVKPTADAPHHERSPDVSPETPDGHVPEWSYSEPPIPGVESCVEAITPNTTPHEVGRYGDGHERHTTIREWTRSVLAVLIVITVLVLNVAYLVTFNFERMPLELVANIVLLPVIHFYFPRMKRKKVKN